MLLNLDLVLSHFVVQILSSFNLCIMANLNSCLLDFSFPLYLRSYCSFFTSFDQVQALSRPLVNGVNAVLLHVLNYIHSNASLLQCRLASCLLGLWQAPLSKSYLERQGNNF